MPLQVQICLLIPAFRCMRFGNLFIRFLFPLPFLGAQCLDGTKIIHGRSGHDFHLQRKMRYREIIIDTEIPQAGRAVIAPGQNPGFIGGKHAPRTAPSCAIVLPSAMVL